MTRLTLAALALVPAMPLSAADPNPEDAKLAARFRAYLDDEFRRHPFYATAQGRHDHDDRLDDLSPEARAEDAKLTKQVLDGLPKAVAYDKLSRAGQIDFEIWQHALKYQLWQLENEDRFASDTRVYGEYISDSVFLLFTQSSLPRERNVANAARRITFIPKVVAAAKASLKDPPRALTEIAVKRNLGAIAFYEKDVFQFAGETPGTSELTGPCREAVKALKDYQEFLERDLLPRSTGDWRLGKKK